MNITIIYDPCCFIPKMTLPTRISETSATLIDNIFTNNIDRAHVSGILSEKFSDHQVIFSLQKCNRRQKLKHSEKYIEVPRVDDPT